MLLMLLLACAPDDDAHLRYLGVDGYDYMLPLEPEFRAETYDYEALADGPGVPFFVDVSVRGDAKSVAFNGQVVELNGQRRAVSPESLELEAPTVVTVEVLAQDKKTSITYTIDVVTDE